MIDFKNINSELLLTPTWILSRIEDSTIFSYYFGKFELGKVYPSKFRKDRNPSTGFYISKSGSIIYNDLTNSEKLNCFEFVMKLYSCNFKQALHTIASDFGLISKENSKVSTQFMLDASEFNKDIKKKTLIQFEPSGWNTENYRFWKLHEISIAELKSENIFPIKKLYLNKSEILNRNNYQRYAYIQEYENEEGKQTGIKVYSPEDPNLKWLSSIPLNIPFDLEKLKFQSDTCIITKSKKDKVVLSKLFSDVFAVQNESESAFTQETQDFIKNHYKKRIVIFGSDDQGVDMCKRFNDKGFDYFNTPREDYEKYGIEDPADYIKAYGLDLLKDLFIKKNLL